MKIISNTHRARASRRHEVRKQVREAFLARKNGQSLPVCKGVGDGQTKVWNFDPISGASVLTYGDFDDQKFSINSQGKVTTNDNDGSEVLEQHLESENIDVNVRRLDDTIVYTVGGKGNKLDAETQVELPAESIEEDLRPDQPVIVNLRTDDGYSSAFAEIRPNGSVAVTADPNVALEEDLPGTGATIKMDKDVTRKVWDTPNLHIEARADGDLLEFSVTGKNKGQLSEGIYTELDAGSLVEYTPKATGPTVMLRDDIDESNACVTFKQDGSVALEVLVACTLDDNKPVTCTYLNIVEEGVEQQQFIGANFKFIARKCDDLLTYSVMVTTAYNTAITSGGTVSVAVNIIEDLIPDEDKTLDYPGIDGLYLLVYGKTSPNKGSALFVNGNTSGSINSIPVTANFTDLVHMNKDTEVIEQNLENDLVEINIRSGDGEDIVFSAIGKGNGTPAGGTTTIFPEGTVDPEFTPAVIDNEVCIPLTNADLKGQDSYLAIKYDGSVNLVCPPSPTGFSNKIGNSVLYIDIEDNSAIKDLIKGDTIELGIHKQGDVIVYSAEALTSSIAAHQEFPVGTIEPEHRPADTITIRIPCKAGSGAKDAYVTINTDGSVDVSAGAVLETAIDCMGYCMDMNDATIELCKRIGADLNITAQRSEDVIVYTIDVTNASVGQGTFTEITTTNALPSEFRPDENTTCEIKTVNAAGFTDTAYALVKTDGTVVLSSAGNTLDTSSPNTAVAIVDDNQFVSTTTETDSTTGLSLTAVREGELVVYKASGDGSTGINVSSSGTQVFAPGTFDPILWCADEPISVPLRTGNNGWGSEANLVLESDGSVKIYSDLTTVNAATIEGNTCRALTWDQSTFDEDEVEYYQGTRGPNDAPGISIGDWVKTAFRKVRDTICAGVQFLSNNGITADLNLGSIDLKLRPDAGGYRIAVNPDSTKAGAEIRVGTDGAVNFHVNNTAQAAISNGVRKFMGTFMNLGSGDIFNPTSNGVGRLPDVFILNGEGRMHYMYDGMTIGTYRRLVPNAQVGGLMDIFSSALSFVKSNIDLKAVGSTLLKAGGNIVTSVIQGKPIGQSITGAFKEVVAGGIGQVFRPDSPIGAVMNSNNGLFSGVMKMLPNGSANIISKGLDFVQNQWPMSTTYINTAKKAIFGNYGPSYVKNIFPRNTQIVDELVAIEAVRHEMTIVYHVCGKNAVVRKGQTQLQGALKGSLCPSHDLMFFVSPSVQILIYQNGQIVVEASEQTQLTDMYIPFTTIKLPNMRTIPVDVEEVKEKVTSKKSRVTKRTRK